VKGLRRFPVWAFCFWGGRQKQIPLKGNDSKKSKSNGKGKNNNKGKGNRRSFGCASRRLASLRMTASLFRARASLFRVDVSVFRVGASCSE
jgi:hypothetical protein